MRSLARKRVQSHDYAHPGQWQPHPEILAAIQAQERASESMPAHATQPVNNTSRTYAVERKKIEYLVIPWRTA
jgi:hypothetical protein